MLQSHIHIYIFIVGCLFRACLLALPFDRTMVKRYCTCALNAHRLLNGFAVLFFFFRVARRRLGVVHCRQCVCVALINCRGVPLPILIYSNNSSSIHNRIEYWNGNTAYNERHTIHCCIFSSTIYVTCLVIWCLCLRRICCSWKNRNSKISSICKTGKQKYPIDIYILMILNVSQGQGICYSFVILLQYINE